MATQTIPIVEQITESFSQITLTTTDSKSQHKSITEGAEDNLKSIVASLGEKAREAIYYNEHNGGVINAAEDMLYKRYHRQRKLYKEWKKMAIVHRRTLCSLTGFAKATQRPRRRRSWDMTILAETMRRREYGRSLSPLCTTTNVDEADRMDQESLSKYDKRERERCLFSKFSENKMILISEALIGSAFQRRVERVESLVEIRSRREKSSLSASRNEINLDQESEDDNIRPRKDSYGHAWKCHFRATSIEADRYKLDSAPLHTEDGEGGQVNKEEENPAAKALRLAREELIAELKRPWCEYNEARKS